MFRKVAVLGAFPENNCNAEYLWGGAAKWEGWGYLLKPLKNHCFSPTCNCVFLLLLLFFVCLFVCFFNPLHGFSIVWVQVNCVLESVKYNK